MDAAEYKHLVLGLIFIKYISDTFAAQQGKVLLMVSDPDSDNARCQLRRRAPAYLIVAAQTAPSQH